jgi:RNA polymerase sigma factor (sigma-70 family)
MATGQLGGVIRRLRQGADGGGMTDGQLLACFITGPDEAAFEALVRRHGPMVLGVCRRVLRHAQDAEDAFQAAFLLLARKAASLKQRELVGNWLYGVALRAALQVRAARRPRERQVGEMPEPEVVEQTDVWDELRPILDEELTRLPEKYRSAVVLCDLEGRTRREVARQLGVPEGTLSGRLTTARRKLARRLAQRGLALGGGLAAVLSGGAASARVPASLVGSTTRAATHVAAGGAAASVVSVQAAAVMEGVLSTMFLSKLKGIAAVLGACLAVGGIVLATFGAAPRDQEGARPAVAADRPATGAGGQPPGPPADKAARREKERPPAQASGGVRSVESDALEALAFSRDSRYLAAGGFGKEVMIWDVKKGEANPRWKLQGPRGFVRRVAFSPDGKRIAAGVDDAVIHLWNVETGKPEAQLRASLPSKPDVFGRTGLVNNIAFLPGNKLVALYTFQPKNAGSPEATGCQIWIWDLATRKSSVLAKEKHSNAVDVAVSPDGKLLACSHYVAGMKVWDLGQRKVVQEEGVGKNEFMSRVAFSPDGKSLAVGGGYMVVGAGGGIGAEGRLWLFDVKARKRLWRVEEEKNGAYNAIGFTADSKGVLTGSSGKQVRVRFKGGATGSKVVSELRRWDVANGKEVWRADGELGWFQTVAASADGKTIAGCDSNHLILFDPATGRRQRVLRKATKGQLE